MFSPEEYPQLVETVQRSMIEKGSLSELAAQSFFSDLRIVYVGENSIVFETANELNRNTIMERYLEPMSDAVAELFGSRRTIDIEVNPNRRRPLEGEGTTVSPLARLEEMRREHGTAAAEPEPAPEEERFTGDRTLAFNNNHTQYTFENFIVGSSNKFAHAAALAVAKNPGTYYNPLFIYGPSGLGKTHLMCAIVNELQKRDPHINALYITGEDFTNEMVSSLSNHSPEAFRTKFRTTDVLLVDDIQFISGKTGTQEEFFHTFNALYSEGRQIILTSDRPPKELTTLEERIRTRFEQGLIADIGMPNYELRLAILTNKAESMDLEVDHEILSYIAESLNSSNRQLEGVLKKMKAALLLGDRKVVDMQMAQECIADLQHAQQPVKDTVEKVFDAIISHYGVKREDLTGNSRTAPIKNPRNMAMYIIRTETNMSYPDIGKIFGDRNHSTVMSNIDSFEKQLKSDPILEKELEEVKRNI